LDSESVATFPWHTLIPHATSSPNESLHRVYVQLLLIGKQEPKKEWLIDTENRPFLENGAGGRVLYHAMEVPPDMYLKAGKWIRYHDVVRNLLGEGRRPDMFIVVPLLETLRDANEKVILEDNPKFRA
jgi:hypothetical protein